MPPPRSLQGIAAGCSQTPTCQRICIITQCSLLGAPDILSMHRWPLWELTVFQTACTGDRNGYFGLLHGNCVHGAKFCFAHTLATGWQLAAEAKSHSFLGVLWPIQLWNNPNRPIAVDSCMLLDHFHSTVLSAGILASCSSMRGSMSLSHQSWCSLRGAQLQLCNHIRLDCPHWFEPSGTVAHKGPSQGRAYFSSRAKRCRCGSADQACNCQAPAKN